MRFSVLSGLGVLLTLCTHLIPSGESAKILNIAFMSSKSHKITYEPLLQELAKRGHEITALSPYPGKNGTNFKNILTIDPEEIYKKAPNFFEMKKSSNAVKDFLTSNPFLIMGGLMAELCEKSYELPQVQEVLKEKWDLIFFTPFFNECLWGLVYKLNTTTIIYNQAGTFPWISDMMGSPSPPSFVSTVFSGYDDRMNFLQRSYNLVRNVLDWSILELYYNPRMERLYRRIFNDPTIPSIKEISRNTSIVLANSHISSSKPRPFLPDIIEVGGLHLTPAKPVQPKELDDFLNGAKDGFIFFSMGSALKGHMIPEDHRKMFLSTFSKLKQRVVWKWETEEMEDLPPNVKLSKWLPQQDVLGHKNIRLFITHGGMGSTAEAIYHGVPLIGIPIFGDQPSNIRKAAQYGFALPPLEFRELTEEILLNALNRILNDPSYRENAKRLSNIFKDQQNSPMDRAVYWVEYVLRHKGAVHMRSAARDLGYIAYFSLDVIAALLLLLLVSFKVNVLILKALYRSFCRRGSKKAAAVGSKEKSQ